MAKKKIAKFNLRLGTIVKGGPEANFGKIRDLLEQKKTQERKSNLAAHRAVLEAFGHQSIESLGKIELGRSQANETLLQPAGVVLPNGNNPTSTKMNLDPAWAALVKKTLVPSSDFSIITTLPASSTGRLMVARSIIPLNVAYWFANDIIIGDNTDILIDSSVKKLVIITNNLTVGNNVRISWRRPELESLAPRPKPKTRPSYPTATSVVSRDGLPGLKGAEGATGVDGASAPEVETWFMTLSGNFPAIDLPGQDGQTGGTGGSGGDGGAGQNGCPTDAKNLNCKQQKGPGGDGGNGGPGGNGGRGGKGGDGGSLMIYTTSQNILSMSQVGFTPDLKHGTGGAGGDAGDGGRGGNGGKKGIHRHRICPSNQRGDGKRGRRGRKGFKGNKGQDGISFPNSLQLVPITQTEFNVALTKPAIISTDRQGLFSYVGDTVTVHGLRFSTTDKIFIQDSNEQLTIECPTTFVANNLLTFVVPKTIGGYTMFGVRQSDGTPSVNEGTLLIRPKIATVLPATRMRPGAEVFIKGTGFDLNGSIRINNQDTGNYEWIDYETIKYKVTRPYNVVRKQSGEEVKLKVVNSEGVGSNNFNHSEEIDVILDTYRIVVFGDSSAWEAGIMEYDKAYSLVKDHIERNVNIGVYLTVEAHIGATIGRGDNNHFPKMHGEMATQYPTINQQVDTVGGQSDALEIDLVIVAGGANDIPVVPYMMEERATSAVIQAFTDRIEASCYRDMKDLLVKIVTKFPSANVLVRSYFHIFSNQSNASAVTLATISAQIALGQILDKGNLEQKILDFATVTGDTNLIAAERATLNNVWVSETTRNLKKAVNEINQESPTNQRTFFVDAQTGPQNAAHAPQSYIWEPKVESLTLRASDPMLAERTAIIDNLYPNKIDARGYSPFFSKRNSSYHPNTAGAKRFFNKMKAEIEGFRTSSNIVLRSFAGSYLSLDLATKKLITTNGQITIDSVLGMVDFGNDRFAFRSVSGEFVCAEQAGGADVNVNRSKAAAWEMFELQPQGGSVFAIRTSNGHYLSVGGNGVINALSTTVSNAEKFQLQ